MYFWGSDSLEDVSGAVLMPTRFVWPHGGMRVFISGTFTRSACQQCNAHYWWSEPVPMLPVEGFPNVFQAICGVAPGLHQYRYYVDDEWRHDEQQPHVKRNYGIVNTLLLTRGTNPVPPILCPGTPESRNNMDANTAVFQHMEATLRVSEADVAIFQHCISVLLSIHSAHELLPESGKVIALDVNLPVKQAFHIFYEQGLSIAPLWNSYKGKFVGVLSPSDFILILRELSDHGSNLTQEELETYTISAWKEGKQLLHGQVDGHGRPVEKQLVHAGACDSLKDVAMKILRNHVATVPIIHTVTDDGIPQLLHVGSLLGILRCICRHLRHSYSFLPILHQPICMFPLGTWICSVDETNGSPLAMLTPNATLGSALALLVQAARVSSIPIVDECGALLDTYCRSDITALAKDGAYAKIRIDEMSILQAIQLRNDASSPYGFFDGQRCQTCLRIDPLQKVIEKMAKAGVGSLIIVEAGSKQVEGIISLSDVFGFLLGWPSSQNLK